MVSRKTDEVEGNSLSHEQESEETSSESVVEAEDDPQFPVKTRSLACLTLQINIIIVQKSHTDSKSYLDNIIVLAYKINSFSPLKLLR